MKFQPHATRQISLHALPRWRALRWFVGALLVVGPWAASAQQSGWAEETQQSEAPDLLNQSESRVAQQLPWRGYAMTHQVSAGGGGYWQFWWNAQRSNCLRVAVNQGRVTQVISVDPAHCPNHGDFAPPPVHGRGDPTDLLHRPESVAANELPRRGYALSNVASAGANAYWQYWWSAQRGQCLRLAVNQAQVTQVVTTGAGECQQRGGSMPQPPAGPREPVDLVNQSAGAVERAMFERGYVLANSAGAHGGGFWQYWWNERGAQCVRLAVNNGHVTQVVSTGRSDCRR